MNIALCLRWSVLLTALPLLAAPPQSVNPTVKQIVDAVSQERITASLKTLESFGTRHLMSPDEHPTRGIGAARRWIFAQFQSYSPRLQVRYDTHRIKARERVPRDVELHNVVALLPGKQNPDHHVIVSGHYDSLNIVRKADIPTKPADDDTGAASADWEKSAAADSAPGVTDDASGTATVLELARVMSQYEFDQTVVFIAFAGEEEGLLGSRLYAANAKEASQNIEAVLNNDIIGSVRAGNGVMINSAVRVFSEDPQDSPSRQLSRYIKRIAARYVPALAVDMVFRADRFSRGGDHTPFNAEGYAAVRFTTPAENYSQQHTPDDTFANTSPPYITQVAKVNAAALASLALAPLAPVISRERQSGAYKGHMVPMITRGRSGYDAQLKWMAVSAPDLAGYLIVSRTTTAPDWERELFVGRVEEYTFPNVSIDDRVFGVIAVDADGNESLVSPYTLTPRPMPKIETY